MKQTKHTKQWHAQNIIQKLKQNEANRTRQNKNCPNKLNLKIKQNIFQVINQASISLWLLRKSL